MSVLSATGLLDRAQGDQYSTALLDLLGTRDPVQVLRETPGALRRALDRIPTDRVWTAEAPGKWSTGIVLAHLSDSELVGAFRLRMILAHDQPALAPYDQDLWASRLHYDRVSPEESLERFSVLRKANLVLWADASDEELARFGVHAERGAESVDRMRRLYAGHDLAHVRQLERIRQAVAGD